MYTYLYFTVIYIYLYFYYVANAELVTGAVLIEYRVAIANANDISRIDKKMLRYSISSKISLFYSFKIMVKNEIN